MNRIKNLQRWIIYAVLCALLFSPTLPGRAQQQPQTITANGTMDCGKLILPLTMTFPPAGGAVTGTASYEGETPISMTGSFTGGDGGQASGTWELDLGGGRGMESRRFLDRQFLRERNRLRNSCCGRNP
jgi:hypothetical protein